MSNIKLEEQQWEVQKDLIQRKQKIAKEKTELIKRQKKLEKDRAKLNKKDKKITTTKLLILFLFINCTIIELFTGWATIQSLRLALLTNLSPDFTPLVTLIGTVVGEVFGFAIYALKSAKENTEGGVVYMAAQNNIDTDSVG